MSTYLDLVNKVIEEGGSELDQLTLGTWSSAEAGRRLYPRIKRLVAEAWKKIQMSRNEWEFNTAELTTVVHPRIKYADGVADTTAPAVGDEFIGLSSGTVIEITVIEPDADSPLWPDGGAYGQLEFRVVGDGKFLQTGETFESVLLGPGDQFTYQEKGTYDFLSDRPGLREPQWATFVGGRGTAYPNPIMYVPWENWIYKSYSFVGTSQTVPAYVSQDPSGRLAFYPQPLADFQINFWYDEEPQALVAPTDIPKEIPGEYHDWIAWAALESLARFDKNPDLFDWASKEANFYKTRAERNLMPLISWAGSQFDKGS